MILQAAAQGSALRSVLEEVGQDETRWFGFHAVNPEVSTAGVVLVTSIHELEVVRLRIKGLQKKMSEKLFYRMKSDLLIGTGWG